MLDDSLSLLLPDQDATARLALVLADCLHPGDVVLLDGQIGAGKTHLARALIRARLGRMEDVPSPTFTLVQTYEAEDSDLWHADLYRLTHPDEVTELGLEAAFETAICLIEWPDRLGDLRPADALLVELHPDGEGRAARLSGGRGDLLARIAEGWADAR